MGTETPPLPRRRSDNALYQVKLNNPLMGTETIFIISYEL